MPSDLPPVDNMEVVGEILRSSTLDLLHVKWFLEENGHLEAAKLAKEVTDALSQLRHQLMEDYKARVGVYST